MDKHKVYIAIDLKSFYASVECVARGLNPLTTKLVVADPNRTDKTICLAVSPALKALGVGGRDRLFQVLQKVTRDSFIIAPPRMHKYVEVSSSIFTIYAKYLAPEDIHIYSIDEAFLDVTSYLNSYEMSAHQLARTIVKDILGHTGITATVGIGENLYLAKIAMDILAKHLPADQDGVRIAELDEKTYRQKLWTHTPLTDFWRIGQGTAKHLAQLGIYTMGDLARFSLTGSAKLYRIFGINAELLIDHAWGYEPTTLYDIKHYQAKTHSQSSGQILPRPYSSQEASVIITEMANSLTLDLTKNHLLTDQISLDLGYSPQKSTNYLSNNQIEQNKNTDKKKSTKHYSVHGSQNLSEFTRDTKLITATFLQLFNKIVNQKLKIRRVNLTTNHLISDLDQDHTKPHQLSLFSNQQKIEHEIERNSKLQLAVLEIQSRFGKNALLRGTSFRKEATMRERNQQIGGHHA